jgi:excisionase family DNA binding protein
MITKSLRAQAGLPLRVTHVADWLHVPPRTIRHWAATGRLPARRLGRKIWGFDAAKVEPLEQQLQRRGRQ